MPLLPPSSQSLVASETGQWSSQQLNSYLGPHEIGAMSALFLFGLVTIQAFTYFKKYPGDSVWIKGMVTFVWLLLLAYNTLTAVSLYNRTVVNYGRTNILEAYPAGMCGTFALSGTIGWTVQSFFAHRLYKFSHKVFVPLICWVLSASRLTILIFVSITTCRTETVHEYTVKYLWVVIAALTLSAVTDVTIAGSLTYCLWVRRKDVFKHAQRVVDKLIVWTIQTGSLTSISSILMLVFYLSMHNFAWMAAYMVIAGLFGNYLLASLNARHSLRDEMDRHPTFLHMPSILDACEPNTESRQAMPGFAPQVSEMTTWPQTRSSRDSRRSTGEQPRVPSQSPDSPPVSESVEPLVERTISGVGQREGPAG